MAVTFLTNEDREELEQMISKTGGGSSDSGQNPGQDGEDGATFTPAVSADGTLSWTNDKGLDNPAPVNIKGPQGEKGETGKDGTNGKDGVSATHTWNGTTLTITSASGTSSADLKGEKGENGAAGKDGSQGPQGDKGETGEAGKDGTSVTVKSVSESTADGGSNVVTFSDGKTLIVKNGAKGSTGADGAKGDTGATGPQGVGIASVAQTTTSTADDGDNVITVTLTDGTKSTFKVQNGSKGSKGDTGTTGPAYTLTAADKNEIVAEVLASMENGMPEITIESKAGGYWNRYDTWYDYDATCAKRTNAIPVTEGDKLSYKGYGADAIYNVVWYGADGAEVGNARQDARTNAITLTAPAGAAYAKFYSFDYVASVDDVVLEVSWVLCQSAGDSGNQSQSQSSLYAKKIVYDGDSICESRLGSTANNGGGYAKIIADMVGGTYANNAVSGAALTSTPSGATYHSVVDSLTALPTDGDLYCFEGGYNDFCRNVEIGTCDDADYTGSVDTSTICGAMEKIFRHCLSVLIGRPVCFVISHKCGNTQSANSTGKIFKDYRDAMIQVCEKYSIPYYDAFTKSGLNGWNAAQSDAYMTANVNGTGDSVHPNEEGYKRYYVPQLISLFESMMPTEVTQSPPGVDEEPIVNLIDEVGYTDGVRLSTSAGTEKEITSAPYTTTGFIKMESANDIYRTSGVVFDGDTYAQSIVCVYDAGQVFAVGSYIKSNQGDGKSLYLTHCNLIMDGNGNLTIQPTAAGVGCYFKLSGYGYGEDLIVTKNQEIT